MNTLQKPKLSFNKLISSMLPHAEKITPQKPGEPTAGLCVDNDVEFSKIFLLVEGFANIRRRDDNLILGTVFAPYVLGVSLIPSSGVYYSIELGPESSLYQLSQIHALTMIKSEGLYREWMRVASYKIALLYERDRNILLENSYDIVCRMLTQLSEFPIYFREHISVIKFIEERTILSRSSIQRILQDMKKKSHIEMEDGRLIKIDYSQFTEKKMLN